MHSDYLIRLAENKYNRLLTVLMGLIVAAVLPQSYDGVKTIGFMLCLVVMLVVMYQINPGKQWMRFYRWLVLGSLLLLTLKILGLFSISLMQYGQIGIQFLVFILMGLPIVPIQREIFLTEKVTADTLKGAIAVYLLIGIAWAMIYTIVYRFDALAFNGISSFQQEADFLHFSFITLTTVGYGNITPVTSFARIPADLEAIIGVMYPSILIARLVSLYNTKAQEL